MPDNLLEKAEKVFNQHGSHNEDIQDSDSFEKISSVIYEKIVYTVPFDATGEDELRTNIFQVKFDENGNVLKFGYI